MDKVPDQLRDKLGIAIGQQVYKAYRDILASDRWQRLANFGARPQRLLFASTGTKDPKPSASLFFGLLLRPITSTQSLEKLFLPLPINARLAEPLHQDEE